MPPPELSIILPVLNEAVLLEPALARLQSWRHIAEIIVVDGGSQDATRALAKPACDHLLLSAPGRARQMNTGAAQARGRYLLFLHIDTQLCMEPMALMRELSGGPRWGFFRVRLSGSWWPLRLVETFMNLRSGISRVATGDQALFVHSELFERLGGFADIELMEDVEMCKRLRCESRGHRLPQTVETSSRRWEANGVVKTVLMMWVLRLAYWLGVRPRRLAQIYRGN